MSQLKLPQPVKPMVAILSASSTAIQRAAIRLEELIGPIEYISEELVFGWSDYYRAEMGWPQYKRFLAGRILIDPTALVRLKVDCVRLEGEMSIEGRRTVNLDPGYISAERLVLATGKNAGHRLYLGEGVWGELTLIYQNGRFEALPWTYPDYASQPVTAIMTDLRRRYFDQLKSPRE